MTRPLAGIGGHATTSVSFRIEAADDPGALVPAVEI